MLILSLAFMAGVLVLQWCAALPPVWFYLAVLAALPFLRWKYARYPVMFILGFFWAAMRAEYALIPLVAPEIEGKTVVLEGVVLDMPRQFSSQRLRFLLDAQQLESEAGWSDFPGKVRLDVQTASVHPVPA